MKDEKLRPGDSRHVTVIKDLEKRESQWLEDTRDGYLIVFTASGKNILRPAVARCTSSSQRYLCILSEVSLFQWPY